MQKGLKRIRIRKAHSIGSFFVVIFLILFMVLVSRSHGKTNQGIMVPEEKIQHALIEYLETHHPWHEADVQIRDIRTPKNVLLTGPPRDISFRVPANTRYLGRTSVEMTFNRGSESQKKIWASAYLEVLAPVVVVKRPLTRNQNLSAQHLSLEKRDLAEVPPGAVTDLELAVGKRLKRTVTAGTVLRRTMVENPPVVNRGDVVRLTIETERLRITAVGRAEERGGVGDTVRVMNLDSKKRVYGEIIDAKTIHVRY